MDLCVLRCLISLLVFYTITINTAYLDKKIKFCDFDLQGEKNIFSSAPESTVSLILWGF